MANQQHVNLLNQGVDVWNNWRKNYPNVQPDLSGAKLHGASLVRANLSNANLSKARLFEAKLIEADLSDADLSEAYLKKANLDWAKLPNANLNYANLNYAVLNRAEIDNAQLYKANLSEAELFKTLLYSAYLSEANLSKANLNGADLSYANLSHADLTEANLSEASLVGTNFNGANLSNCSIYGISAWDVKLTGAIQLNLTITREDQLTITVDNLKIAQFIYLLLNNAEIREVINTLTTKSVLILGRFTPERKVVLEALRDALRKHNYLPILFDFDPASTQTIRETVRTLAHLSHFIIADLTSPNSIPEELETIVPTLAVPIQPLLEITQKREFSMFKGYGVYPWVLPIYRYTNLEGLVNNLQEKVIEPATKKARELANKKGHLNQEPFEQIF